MGMVFSRKRVFQRSCPLCLTDNDDATDREVQCKECNVTYRQEVHREQILSKMPAKPTIGPPRTLLQMPKDFDRDSSLDSLRENENKTEEELHAFKRIVLEAEFRQSF